LDQTTTLDTANRQYPPETADGPLRDAQESERIGDDRYRVAQARRFRRDLEAAGE